MNINNRVNMAIWYESQSGLYRETETQVSTEIIHKVDQNDTSSMTIRDLQFTIQNYMHDETELQEENVR